MRICVHIGLLSGPWGDLSENVTTYLLLLSSRASKTQLRVGRVCKEDKLSVLCRSLVGGAWRILEEPAQSRLKF